MRKMRYQWLTEAPRNVSEAEYGRYNILCFTAVLCGLGAVILLIIAILGSTLRQSRELAALPAMSLADAFAFQGDSTGPVKIEGRFIGEAPVAMPDDDQTEVSFGELRVIARTRDSLGTERREVLFEWQHQSENAYLTDGDRRIPIDLVADALPWVETPHFGRPRIIYEGEYARTSVPVGIEYGDMTLPLPEQWGKVDTVYADLERQLIPNDQPVVIVCNVVSTPDGPRLTAPSVGSLQILPGNETEIREAGELARGIFSALWIPLLALSLFLGRKAWMKRNEFLVRSNQP